jgi:hypothetical protein
MKVVARLLEEQAEQCIQLAYQCQNKKAEKVLRLLAVDLMLAAQSQRTSRPETPERPKSLPEGDRFSELEQIMRAVTFMNDPQRRNADMAKTPAA